MDFAELAWRKQFSSYVYPERPISSQFLEHLGQSSFPIAVHGLDQLHVVVMTGIQPYPDYLVYVGSFHAGT